MMLIKLHSRALLLFVCLAFVCLAVPAYSKDAKFTLYLPISSQQFPSLKSGLQEALTAQGLGQLEIKTADFWQSYQQGIRHGRIGIYFAAPHYSAWAIQQHNFSPLLRLPNSLKYVVAARQNDSHFFEVTDLAQQPVCTQRGLNLDYILLGEAFGSGLLSAQPLEVWSVVNEMREDADRCKAFSVSNHLFEELDVQQPNMFIRLAQGESFNNYAFIAHPDVPARIKTRLKRFLQSNNAKQMLQELYRFYSSSTSLLRARKSDYPAEYIQPLSAYWATEQTE